MVNICHHKATGDGLGEPAAALFQRQWQLYREFVDNNYFYHREVYGQLHRILAKLSLMREIRSVLGDHGLFLIYENASPRRRGPRRLAASLGAPEPAFVDGIDTREYEAMRAHVRANDFPETTSRWHSLGREAGFGGVRELFVAPTDLFRMYCFLGQIFHETRLGPWHWMLKRATS